MNNEVLVKAEGVSKKFCRDLKRSLWYGVKDITSEIFGANKSNELRKDEFWAVKDVSFELKRGECLGLIGHNGAGKSTLLKILNGLIKPDKGKITIHGRIGALIELGTGFNPILTGRENIYNNGTVLGFSKKELDSKFNSIVNFAEIENFLDTPVQNYSSGMKVRLGFAVAAQMEPDVLLIDEVLAVGDVGFRIKCLNVIAQLMKKTAVIFVSHAMPQIARVSNNILLMKNGINLFNGYDVPRGIEKYYNEFPSEDKDEICTDLGRIENYVVEVNGEKKSVRNIEINYGQQLKIHAEINISNSIKQCILNVVIFDMDLKGVAQISPLLDGTIINNTSGKANIIINIPEFILSTGKYEARLILTEYLSDYSRSQVIHQINSAFSLCVKNSVPVSTPILLKSKFNISY